jgi:HEAT repeat protein
MPFSIRLPILLVVAAIVPCPARAQTGAGGAADQQVVLPPAAMPVEEASALASGWVLLAEGKALEAATHATELVARYPDSVLAIGFAVEADIAQGGPRAALARYESWLGIHAEEPGLLRRIARAVLHEWGRQASDPALRAEALEALSFAGEPGARAALVAGANQGSTADLAALAALGDEDAVRALIGQVEAASGNRHREIDALARSRSALAVPPLVEVLGDQNEVNRVAAARALGTLGQPAAVDALKSALADPRGAVRLEAAGALFALGDYSGYELLTPLLSDPNPQIRMSGVALFASQPDAAWTLEAERLMQSAEDPYIRLQAAKLLAPHNPDAALPVIRGLVGHANPAIREAAGPILATSVPDDLTELRQLLRGADGRVKVRAAARILAVTR